MKRKKPLKFEVTLSQQAVSALEKLSPEQMRNVCRQAFKRTLASAAAFLNEAEEKAKQGKYKVRHIKRSSRAPAPAPARS